MFLSNLLLAFITFVFIIHVVYKYNLFGNLNNYWKSRGVYTVKYASIWERVIKRIPVHILDTRAYEHGKSMGLPWVGYTEFGVPTLMLIDQNAIKNVLVKDLDYFTDRRDIVTIKEDGSSDVLFTLQGEKWKNMRHTLTPIFTTGKIKRMFDIFESSGHKLVKYLNNRINANSEESIEVKDVFGRYTLDVISSAAFGLETHNFEKADSEFSILGRKFQDGFSGFSAIYKILVMVFLPPIAKLCKMSLFEPSAIKFLRNVIYQNIQRRERNQEKRNDFLQLLIDLKHNELGNENDELDDESSKQNSNTKVKLNDELIFAQSLVFFIAGFDTTETLLICSAYELALSPNVQDKLYEEIMQAVETNDGKLSYEIINQLEYLDCVVSEVLRRYAPLGRLERKCVKDYTFPDSKLSIKKGTIIGVPAYCLHHDPEFFPNPYEFNPDNFKDVVKSELDYKYMPFGRGGRNCIGMRFALVEGKTALATLIMNFKIEPSQSTDIPMKFGQTITNLKPSETYLRFKPRNSCEI